MTLTGSSFWYDWEVILMTWLQRILPSAVIQIISQFSLFGEEVFLIALLGFLYWTYDKQLARKAGICILAACIWNPMLKNIAVRRRPYMDHEGIQLHRLIKKNADPMDVVSQGYSFPSGHSTVSSSVFSSLAYYSRHRVVTILSFVIPLLVGVSRVVVGAHYPTDVIAGLALGYGSVLLVAYMQETIKDRRIFLAILTVSFLPGFFYCRSEDFFTIAGIFFGFLFADPLEEKYIRFEMTRNPVNIAIRILGGAAAFYLLNAILKMPFSYAFLHDGSTLSLLVRFLRYFLISLFDFVVYPLSFRYLDRLTAEQHG